MASAFLMKVGFEISVAATWLLSPLPPLPQPAPTAAAANAPTSSAIKPLPRITFPPIILIDRESYTFSPQHARSQRPDNPYGERRDRNPPHEREPGVRESGHCR